MKTVCLGSGFYIPVERIIHIFPADSNMARKVIAGVKANNQDGSRIYDCTGRRRKSSVVVVAGDSTGAHIVISPLTSKTIARKINDKDV